MNRFCFAFVLALGACAAPLPTPDAQPDAAASDDAQSDAQSDDVTIEPMDSGPDAEPDVIVEPMDTGVIVDTGVPPRDSGVPPVDSGVRDTGLPPCTLDPRNCGMCGRVCGAGVLSGRPACAEVGPSRWDCVNNCGGFGEGCDDPAGGRTICCASGCAAGGVGCR